MTDNKVFLSELRDLLKKYDATISFSVSDSSDTHGLSDEKMVVSRRFNDKPTLTVRGWNLMAANFPKR